MRSRRATLVRWVSVLAISMAGRVAAQPANDDCTAATVIGALPFTDTVDIATATTEPGDLSCHDPGAEFGGTPEPLSVWYRYTASEDVVLRVETDALGPGFEAASIVAFGSCGALALANCNAQIGNAVAVTPVTVPAGATVYIAVVDEDVFTPLGGSVQIDVTGVPVVPPTPVPQGPDLQINVEGQGYQLDADVGGAADGTFVVTWQTGSFAVDPDPYGIAFRRFDAAGMALTGDVLVNTYTTDAQERPALAMRSNGEFVVVWQSYRQDGGDEDGIFGRRFDATAAPAAGEFQISEDTAFRQAYADVAVDETGNVLVVWQSLEQDGDDWGIFGRAFDASGIATGSEFQINTYTTDVQSSPAVAADPAGGFVVVWESYGQDGDDYGAFGRRVDVTGAPVGAEFAVTTATAFDQDRPDVAGHPAGGFVVTWREVAPIYGPAVRRFDATGAATTPALAVATTDEYLDFYGKPRVTSVADDGFVVVWPHEEDYGKLDDTSSGGIAGQRLTSDLGRVGEGFQVNTYTVGVQTSPAVAAVGDEFVVAFGDLAEVPGRDSFGPGIFLQRLALPSMATTLGVRPTKLIVVDKVAASGAAKVVYVSKDQAAGITKGAGTAVDTVSARFDVAYDSAHGGFVAPAGAGDGTAGWLTNKLAVAKYVNKGAGLAQGDAIKVTVLKTGKLIKVVTKGLGDDATLDIVAAGPPVGAVTSCYTITNGDDEFRFGSTWAPGGCTYKEIAGGTGRKLACKSGTADPTCAAAP